MKIARAALVLFALCALAATGCAPQHVRIALPKRDAPMADRVAAYNTYRPKASVTVTYRGDSTQTLRLANDDYVSYPEDLLPAVEQDSITARHIERGLNYELPSHVVEITGTLATVGWLTSIFAYGFTDGSTYTKPLTLTLLATSIACFAVDGFWLSPAISEARAEAFESYDGDLLTRLRMQRRASVQSDAVP